MATGVKSWSTTAASNASADSTINWSEGMAPSLVNDSARAEMAAVAAWYAQIAGGTVVTGTVGGTANTITLTCSPTVDALATGQRYLFKYTSTGTTGAVTLQVDSTSAIALRYKDVALISGDIATNDWVFVIYDGTRYQMINPPRASGAATDLTTDSTGGATGDFIPFIDASESNAANKVLTTDLMANMIANFTTKTTPVAADKLMIGDSAASGAAKISTIQQLFNSINGLTADATPDATADYVVTYDASATGAKKVLLNLATPASTQAQQEAASSTLVFVTPGRQQYHPSASKFWAYSIVSAGVPSSGGDASYNLTSIADTALGKATFTIGTDFSSATWCCQTTHEWATGEASGQISGVDPSGLAAGTVVVRIMSTGASSNATNQDPNAYHVAGFGDQ